MKSAPCNEELQKTISRALIVGLGSMGRRRLRLLSRFFPDLSLAVVDCREERREFVAREFDCLTFDGFREALESFAPQSLIVSTSPEAHAPFLTEAIRMGIHTFSELDLLDDGYDAILPLEEKGFPVAFLSSTPLYRSENRWIIGNHEKTGARKFYTYHVGQYLPDWHPWEKYDEFFVGSPRTNAIREILCIELPWLTECFGKVTDFSCSWSRTSSLNLPYPDTCQVLLRHADGTAGNLTVDCVSRKAVRNLRISGEEGTILWEGNSRSLCYLSPSGEPVHPLLQEKELERQAGYAEFISESPYLEELRHFFSLVSGETAERGYSYARHREILRLVDELERVWREQ
ncbi:MAG: Gfo/Idh/MocA family oxidoreductase [Aminivibrio sp.]|uniref:Gfo/Idh/MocA family oxidoreductase n=1 Tax=Aminivibrio sp. TaxID=1872489 RepID=UPI002B21F1FA|nr:Gfo/Idh/MocA family oxidoreductase [Aminivibrio sp.]MEA4952500.1 Gfo/Idh/MocA family oxidoreductase [Aminivibrio sp.]